jgi:hypothetical protein
MSVPAGLVLLSRVRTASPFAPQRTTRVGRPFIWKVALPMGRKVSRS